MLMKLTPGSKISTNDTQGKAKGLKYAKKCHKFFEWHLNEKRENVCEYF